MLKYLIKYMDKISNVIRIVKRNQEHDIVK